MNYQCQGGVKQRYWGDFSILVLLTFNNEEEARKALPALQQVKPTETFMDAVGATCESIGWIQGETYPDILSIEVGGDDVDKIVSQLVEYGAEEKKILSCKHSIDWGEEFTCSIPRVYVEHPNQMKLELI